ncbi:hypothetical protein AB0B89_25100 [Sphaerisporangium sp. NPDC049002]|uniref:hypothetical protein n=1 Tax=Sphaerisporangium sp. NPDC049002 TaxID=3155392 RepID=UPI00340972CE
MDALIFEKDVTFWYETLRLLGHIAYGGADIGEVITTAPRIDESDYDSWHKEWRATADRAAGIWVTGARSSRGYAAKMLGYHLRDGIAERIRCPTLVCSAPGDFDFQGQPEALHDHLTCPRTFLEFTAEEGADAHCHSGAQRLAMARISDWLDETFRSEK